jgi:hypothetical protein
MWPESIDHTRTGIWLSSVVTAEASSGVFDRLHIEVCQPERRAVTGCHRNQWYNVAHAGHCAMHGSFSTLWFRQLTCRGGKDRSSDDKLIPRLASRRRLRTCSGRARETAGNRIMRAAMCCRCVLACMLDEGVCM